MKSHIFLYCVAAGMLAGQLGRVKLLIGMMQVFLRKRSGGWRCFLFCIVAKRIAGLLIIIRQVTPVHLPLLCKQMAGSYHEGGAHRHPQQRHNHEQAAEDLPELIWWIPFFHVWQKYTITGNTGTCSCKVYRNRTGAKIFITSKLPNACLLKFDDEPVFWWIVVSVVDSSKVS